MIFKINQETLRICKRFLDDQEVPSLCPLGTVQEYVAASGRGELYSVPRESSNRGLQKGSHGKEIQ